MRLVEELTDLQNNFLEWNSTSMDDKNSYLCMRVACDGCPLNYMGKDGVCKGRKYIYEYASALKVRQNSSEKISKLEEENRGSINIEDKNYNQTRIDQHNKFIIQADETCRRIMQSISLKEVDESKIPQDIPKASKKKGRVWTEEQKKRACETRRKTLELKKLAEQNQSIPKKEIEEVIEKKYEPISNCIQEAVEVIMTRIQEIHDKMDSMIQSIEDLRKQGVEIEYSIPDLGEEDLNEDLKLLDQASKVVNKYLGQGTDSESVHS